MVPQPLQVSEVRRRLSALVERVAHGGAPIAIGRYGRERAVLVGAEQYARLVRTSKTLSRRNRATLEGTLELTCTPAELIKESRRMGESWMAAVDGRARQPPRRRPARRT